MRDFLLRLLLKSTGLKRNIASLLSVLLVLSNSIPTLAPYATTIEYLAGLFGAVGLGHAALSGNLTNK